VEEIAAAATVLDTSSDPAVLAMAQRILAAVKLLKE